jgi:2-keto-4-pentenoate hydratase/2-oxohepta-3-ene-1,7-dioic acid hydratase in catechol pathway
LWRISGETFLSASRLTASARYNTKTVTKYIRYSSPSCAAYGILEGDTVRQIEGDLFGSRTPNGVTHALSSVKVLAPLEPGKILAVGLNYKSHLGSRPQPAHPEMFYKPVSAVQNPGDPIAIPRDASDVHSEGEMVVVVGKKLQKAGLDEARDAIFGVTAGNDVSDRSWQHGEKKDLQWWRAKGSDTFAPLGPAILAGADYGNLLLQTRINGEVVQKQYTSDLIFPVAEILSWVSGWVTLLPGDVIYTGTPGNTRKMSPGDVVEVELEHVGILRNPVA